MHISHIEGAAAFFSVIPVKSVCWGQAAAVCEAGVGFSKVHHLIKAGLLDGRQRGVESVIN